MGEVVPARASLTLHPPFPPTVHQLSRLALLRVNDWLKVGDTQWIIGQGVIDVSSFFINKLSVFHVSL